MFIQLAVWEVWSLLGSQIQHAKKLPRLVWPMCCFSCCLSTLVVLIHLKQEPWAYQEWSDSYGNEGQSYGDPGDVMLSLASTEERLEKADGFHGSMSGWKADVIDRNLDFMSMRPALDSRNYWTEIVKAKKGMGVLSAEHEPAACPGNKEKQQSPELC